ncbi:MAG: hypothetical protein FDX18_02005 [Chlorobium sp.]|nr:MAG: hypothetical protein FDX18_02005 [Chlorobium sp.]
MEYKKKDMGIFCFIFLKINNLILSSNRSGSERSFEKKSWKSVAVIRSGETDLACQEIISINQKALAKSVYQPIMSMHMLCILH